jgi:hypothetical protein
VTVIRVEPTREHPVPFDLADTPVPTLLEELAVSGNTAEFQKALGATLGLSGPELTQQAELLGKTLQTGDRKNLQNFPTALAAAAFIREYGSNLALDIAGIRSALTHKLLEIANCGDIKHELKAIELLGKHSDISLFTERSEVTVNYNSPEALEKAITDRVRRLLNADVIDVIPLHMNLDEELGVFRGLEEVKAPKGYEDETPEEAEEE